MPAGPVYTSGDADADADVDNADVDADVDADTDVDDTDVDADVDVDDADATFFPLLLKGSPPLGLAAHSPTPCELLRVRLNGKWFQLPESPL